jgi:hypothetical protein
MPIKISQILSAIIGNNGTGPAELPDQADSGINEWVPIIFGMYFLAINLYTFRKYAEDKQAAINGEWRTSNATLHTLRLAYFCE